MQYPSVTPGAPLEPQSKQKYHISRSCLAAIFIGRKGYNHLKSVVVVVVACSEAQLHRGRSTPGQFLSDEKRSSEISSPSEDEEKERLRINSSKELRKSSDPSLLDGHA